MSLLHSKKVRLHCCFPFHDVNTHDDPRLTACRMLHGLNIFDHFATTNSNHMCLHKWYYVFLMAWNQGEAHNVSLFYLFQQLLMMLVCINYYLLFMISKDFCFSHCFLRHYLALFCLKKILTISSTLSPIETPLWVSVSTHGFFFAQCAVVMVYFDVGDDEGYLSSCPTSKNSCMMAQGSEQSEMLRRRKMLQQSGPGLQGGSCPRSLPMMALSYTIWLSLIDPFLKSEY